MLFVFYYLGCVWRVNILYDGVNIIKVKYNRLMDYPASTGPGTRISPHKYISSIQKDFYRVLNNSD